jgi:hypothetical protein
MGLDRQGDGKQEQGQYDKSLSMECRGPWEIVSSSHGPISFIEKDSTKTVRAEPTYIPYKAF